MRETPNTLEEYKEQYNVSFKTQRLDALVTDLQGYMHSYSYENFEIVYYSYVENVSIAIRNNIISELEEQKYKRYIDIFENWYRGFKDLKSLTSELEQEIFNNRLK